MPIVNDLITEKLRPKTLEQCILKKDVYSFLKNIQDSPGGLSANLLLYGTQGAGKTTISRILAAPYETKEINCSQTGIDVVRTDIQQFASQASIMNAGRQTIKVVLLEECDGFTAEAWNAFRNTFEKYTTTVRFIANCNNINKVPDPIRSRFTCLCIEPVNQAEREEVIAATVQRVTAVLKALGIASTPEAVTKFVSLYYPDIRTIFNECERMRNFGYKELNDQTLAQTFNYEDLYEVIFNGTDPQENFRFVRDNYDDPDAVISQLGMKLPEYIRLKYPQLVSKIPAVIIAIAESLHAIPISINRKITLAALIFKLQQIVRT